MRNLIPFIPQEMVVFMFIGGLIAISDRRYRIASTAVAEAASNKVAA